MGALIAGLDISAERLDCALIPLDPDDGSDAPLVTLRHFDLPKFAKDSSGKYKSTPAYRRVERCRVIRDAMRDLLADTHLEGGPFLWTGHEVAHVCIEEPFGSVSRSTVLWEILGAILATIPPHIERDTITTHEWRRIIWPEGPPLFEHETPTDIDWKAHAVSQAFHDVAPHDRAFTLNEHEAEALLIACACRTRLEKAVAT